MERENSHRYLEPLIIYFKVHKYIVLIEYHFRALELVHTKKVTQICARGS